MDLSRTFESKMPYVEELRVLLGSAQALVFELYLVSATKQTMEGDGWKSRTER